MKTSNKRETLDKTSYDCIPVAYAVPVQAYAEYHKKPNSPISSDQTKTPHFATRVIDFGRKPTRVTCPYCNHDGFTRTKKVISSMGIVSAGFMCFIFWPLFWVPL